MSEPVDEKFDFEPEQLAEQWARAVLGDEYDSIVHNEPIDSLPEFLGISGLEEEIGLPKGFFEDLAGEDDWSAIIKLHALFEAALTHLLKTHFGEPGLADCFARLDTSNLKTGKLAFADGAGLIDKDTKRFVVQLSKIRNDFVHDVSNVGKSLSDYIRSLDPGPLKGFRKSILLGYAEGDKLQIRVDEQNFSIKAMLQTVSIACFDHVPRLSFWFCALYCLRSLYRQSLTSDFERLKREIGGDIITQAIENSQPQENA